MIIKFLHAHAGTFLLGVVISTNRRWICYASDEGVICRFFFCNSNHQTNDPTMLMASYTDKELVAKLTAGDAAASRYLYQQYAATFYAIILKNVIKPAVAADLLEQLFSRVPQQISSYNALTQRFFIWMLHLLKSDVLTPYLEGRKGMAEVSTVKEVDSASTRKQRSASELSTFYKLSPTQVQSILAYQSLP